MSIYDKSSLVLIPSGTKTGKVYSQKPVSGDGDFTFTRSSAATRVNADGLVEKETQNLLEYSNSFTSGDWDDTGSSFFTSGQSGYDGTNNAWLFTATSAGERIQLNISKTGVHTLSTYFKKGTADGVRMRVDSLGTDAHFYVNLIDGTQISASGEIATEINDIGSGWYRVVLTSNWINVSNIRIYPINTSGVDVSGTIYIQDAQLEQGLVARDYIETTTTAVEGGITDNVPRLDYTDSSCPALLLEPLRSNLYQHSEYIFNFQGTETFNDSNSPEGVSNAVKLTKTSASDQFVNMSWSGSSLTASTDYTMSLFVKHAGDDVDVRYEYNNSNDWGKGWYALFQVRSSGVTASTTNLCTSDVQDYGNGWYRILVFVETASSITPSSPSNLLRVVGASGDDVLLYGAGMEAGSYATSYIPTYGSSVTRVPDASSVTGVSSLIGQTEGTLFVDIDLKGTTNSDQIYIEVNDGTASNKIYIGLYGIYSLFRVVLAGSELVNINNTLAVGNRYKMALTYKSNSVKAFINGSKIGEDTSASIPSCSTINLNTNASGQSYAQVNVQESLVFPTALTDQEAIDLTTI